MTRLVAVLAAVACVACSVVDDDVGVAWQGLTAEEWRQQCAPVPPCDPRFVAARCEDAGGTWRPAREWGDEPACCEVYVACEPGLSRADCKALGGLWSESAAGACCEAPR